jgi:hypothetical protein
MNDTRSTKRGGGGDITGLCTARQASLWDEQLGIYANKFSGNGSFYPRRAPGLALPRQESGFTSIYSSSIVAQPRIYA